MANTSNFSIEKPVSGGSRNSWGGLLNLGSDKMTELLALALPIGSIQMYPIATAPTPTSGVSSTGGKWLVCDGSLVTRSTYSALFSLIGTTYGAGDGSSNFALPDLRSRVPVGYNTDSISGRSTRAIAAASGAETHTLTDTQIPKHQHPITDNGHVHPITSDPGHFHVGDQTGGKTGMKTLAITDPKHSHTAEYVNDWSSGSGTYRLDIDSAGGVDGTWTSDSSSTGISIADHDHSLTTDTKTTGITTTATNPTRITTTNEQPDGDASHNIMQPYLVVQYIILAAHPTF